MVIMNRIPIVEGLDDWARTKLADPITKEPCGVEKFKVTDGILDARVCLKHTHGFSVWSDGQDKFEDIIKSAEAPASEFREEIERDRPVYDHFNMAGEVLDVGGMVGTVREFLDEKSKLLSVDPFISSLRG